MDKCKITVLKRTINQDIIDEYLDGEMGPCDSFQESQEFVVESPFAPPDGFCPWAWADMRKDIFTVVLGGNFPWVKPRGTTITCCTDGFRPVIFKIERID
jgi:uncharacterized repeat protein (TIGR04076 family)